MFLSQYFNLKQFLLVLNNKLIELTVFFLQILFSFLYLNTE